MTTYIVEKEKKNRNKSKKLEQIVKEKKQENKKITKRKEQCEMRR